MIRENIRINILISRFFLTIIVAVAILLYTAIGQGYLDIYFLNGITKELYEIYHITSLYNIFGFITSEGIFLFVLALLATIPAGVAYLDDRNSGFINNILCRMSKRKYLIEKYVSSFIVSFCAILISLSFVFYILSLFIPATDQSPVFAILPVVEGQSFSVSLYYSNPLLYSILRMLLISFSAACISSFAFCISSFTRNKFIAYASPFMLIVAINALINGLSIRGASIESFLGNNYLIPFSFFIGFFLLVSLLSFVIYYIKIYREDIL